MTHCKVATQLYQKTKGNVSHYVDFVQCQSETGKHGTFAPTYKEMKKKFPFTNNVEHKFWFGHDDIKGCVSCNKYKYAVDWPIVPKT